tara:strand:+ start:52 stop:237 length:186 start_codon:yes stop_codon:yes gene_type:complete
MEHKDSIEFWIYTSENVNKTIKKALDRYDTETIISLLNEFKKATEVLQKLIEMSNEEKFTA